jgi:hypothetical protein
MGMLTVLFTIRIYNTPIALVLSLVTSSIMLGMKLDKLTLLKQWCAPLQQPLWLLVTIRAAGITMRRSQVGQD